jgi:hypothetical protein
MNDHLPASKVEHVYASHLHGRDDLEHNHVIQHPKATK